MQRLCQSAGLTVMTGFFILDVFFNTEQSYESNTQGS